MENRVKISVILPSLNVGTYIRECIESVRGQSLQDMEIICVDAGSTDGTLEILKEYEKKDSRIKVMISDRKSYGCQMNIGMDIAEGEYIGIVETDDYIPRTMYEDLYRVASENKVDFVKADFYRFTGEGENRRYTLNRLAYDNSYYNRIIDIEKAQECFRFLINTWSGIYNRDYLLKYNICHNETPGASFQDNGFWFQTFAYAKKAYFVDKPYYMNRRDNLSSSVFRKDKTYNICDEYDFIKRVLSRNKEKLYKLKAAYSWACFAAYHSNLERIAEEDEEDFVEKFSEDFYQLQKQEILDLQLFHREEKETLFSIMKEPQYFQKHSNTLKKKHIQNRIRVYENVIIYGAGTVGKGVLNELVCTYRPIKVHCFAVSKMEGNPEKYQGIPVYEIQDLLEFREKSLIIIAVSSKYQSEIKTILKDLGFAYTLDMAEYRG